VKNVNFSIALPTDMGFIGRECSGSKCNRYFRVHVDSVSEQMYCPYCGTQFSNAELHTHAQVKYAQEVGQEKVLEYACGEIDKMFGNLEKRLRGSKFVKFEHRPIGYRAKPVPQYQEQKVDTELVCPECAFQFQVFGIFGFCPGCRTENMMVYDANLAIIKTEITNGSDMQRSLRHAYADLVSTFEQFCTKKASAIEEERPSFQELFAARQFFKKHKNVDILNGLSNDQLLCIRRVFQKRHAYQHSSGKITEKYVKKIPEDSALLGTQARLSLEEFSEAAKILRIVVDALSGY